MTARVHREGQDSVSTIPELDCEGAKHLTKFEADALHWYAFDVVRQKEYVAGLILNRMGCMTFIPTEMRFRKKNRYSKSKIEVAHAGIPGVVFAGFATAPNWYRVMSLHLVNGVLSIDDKPWRIDTAGKEWIRYRSKQIDGQLVVERHRVMFRGAEVERSAALVQVQGRGVIRAPWALKGKAGSDRPVIIKLTGERARMLYSILPGVPQPVLQAA